MDNKIEQCLNHFFQRLGHTPGPWRFEDEFVRSNKSDDFGNVVADTSIKPYPQFEDEQNANGLLVAQAPAMLRTLCRTYLHLLTHTKSLYLPELLVPLRDQISEATGISWQEVQDTFEQYALWIQIDADIPERIREEEEKDDMMLPGHRDTTGVDGIGG